MTRVVQEEGHRSHALLTDALCHSGTVLTNLRMLEWVSQGCYGSSKLFHTFCLDHHGFLPHNIPRIHSTRLSLDGLQSDYVCGTQGATSRFWYNNCRGVSSNHKNRPFLAFLNMGVFQPVDLTTNQKVNACLLFSEVSRNPITIKPRCPEILGLISKNFTRI